MIKKGDKVTVGYEGTLDDGTVFDCSENHEKPLKVTIGQGQVIPGFENAMIGMKKGEEKKIKLSPSEAYGDHNPALVKIVPKEALPKGVELKKGMMIALSTPDGKRIPAIISEIKDDKTFIDFNHPLAGKTLNFKIKIIEIN